MAQHGTRREVEDSYLEIRFIGGALVAIGLFLGLPGIHRAIHQFVLTSFFTREDNQIAVPPHANLSITVVVASVTVTLIAAGGVLLVKSARPAT